MRVVLFEFIGLLMLMCSGGSFLVWLGMVCKGVVMSERVLNIVFCGGYCGC